MQDKSHVVQMQDTERKLETATHSEGKDHHLFPLSKA